MAAAESMDAVCIIMERCFLTTNFLILRNASKDLFRFIQTSIILGQTDQLLSKMTKDAEASGKSGASLRPHMLRFMAHFVLLLRSKGINVPKAEGDYFITKYVEFLISRKLVCVAGLPMDFFIFLELGCNILLYIPNSDNICISS